MVTQARFMHTEQTSFQDLPISQTEDTLEAAIHRATEALLAQQQSDGHWVYELEADCTIPAEYILMMHYMDEIDEALQTKIANYLRAHQNEQGAWPLYTGGKMDISCSVKAFYALKLAGDSSDTPHMARARRAILAAGGAAKSNVFTRITLALFQQVPWRATPFIPVEAILLPRWFPFHLSKVSYWSRTVMVPLLILCSLKPKAVNPKGVDVRELFRTPPELEKDYFERPKSALGRLLLGFDYLARHLEWLIPRAVRAAAIRRATHWFTERLNGEDGLGGIFPAMVNAHEALALLGFPNDHPYRLQTRAALKKMLVTDEDRAYCQPCLSPMWDTGLACLSLLEVNRGIPCPAVLKGLDWLKERQLNDELGDWREYSPGLKGGGWPFEYANDYYPDLDDTSLIGWAMEVADPARYRDSIAAAAEWINGMQSNNGGFASFDRDNSCYYLNHIPFADHGALLDPPTEDVTARCVALLWLADRTRYRPALEAAIGYLKNTQQANGSWYGRWGTNYIYGTWSVLSALEIAGEDPHEGYIRRAVEWLKQHQHIDGGWGESNDSYYPGRQNQAHPSTAYSTAWAMLALMASGEVDGPALERGAKYLLMRQQRGGQWYEDSFTAPGFPRVFFLKYHGYTKYFPLWALAQYRNRRR
ncbi:MAG: squalene--hopene cyclase [Gammaproteobacteria bacterium]